MSLQYDILLGELRATDKLAGDIPSWTPNTFFILGKEAIFNGAIYSSVSEHTSGIDFNTDLTAGKWTLISGIVNVPDKNDKELFVLSDISTDNTATGLIISGQPKGYVSVIVDGTLELILGDQIKTKDCYFSEDSGITTKASDNIIQGDELFVNAIIMGFILKTTMRISFNYSS